MSDAWFKMFRRVFERDGYHKPMMFLFRGTQMVKFIPYEIEERAQKYVIMRTLASEARSLWSRCGAACKRNVDGTRR